MSFAVNNSTSPRPLARRLFRWTLQAALVAALVVQLRVLSDGGLRLPDFAREKIVGRLAEEGLLLDADAIWLDPRGRVLVLRPRLGLAGHDSAFASARAVSVHFRRRGLLVGEFQPTRVETADLALTLPAMASPTGARQPLLQNGEFRLARPAGTGAWRVEQASARLLEVPAAFAGTLPAARGDPGARRPLAEVARETVRQAGAIYRRLAALPLASLRVVRVDLSGEDLALAAELDHLEAPAHPALPPALVGASLDEVSLRFSLPLFALLEDPDAAAELRLLAGRVSAPPALQLRGEGLVLRARLPRAAGGPPLDGATILADLAFDRIEKLDTVVPPAPLLATARVSPVGRALRLDFATRLADAPWQAGFVGDGLAQSGALTASGPLTPALLELVRPYLPEKARPILELTDPLELDLSAELAPGLRPGRVVARAAAGRAVAGRVPFDRAAAVLDYDPAGKSLRADDLLLVQGDSLAAGSYAMDTETLAYRFLLAGPFRPASINNWFSGWWTGFWGNFAFGLHPPGADVDIQGVWRESERTTVFVRADSDRMRLRELDLDSLHTRLVVSAGAFDILGFQGAAGPFAAAGRFARVLGPDREGWSYMSFDVRSDFPVEALPKLFPDEAPALVSAFAFTTAPRLHLRGEAHGPASDRAGSQRYDLDLAATAPLRYGGFPLDHLSLRLERRDADLHLRDIRAGFASGVALGDAKLSGPDDQRWLAFDLALGDADLDLVQSRWLEFRERRDTEGVPPAAAPAKVPDAKAPIPTEPHTPPPPPAKAMGGRLSMRLVATGPLDDPLGFSGRGEAKITGADLARIRLMGPFSSLLSELGVGFATVKLTEADARLSLDRRRVVFEELRLTGPSALVESKGVYLLPAGELDFKAKMRPFEQREGILGTAAGFVLSPLTHALEVELSGTIDEPTWSFSYGPTKLFRRITDRF